MGFAEASLQRIPLSLVRPSSLIFDEGFRVSRGTRTAKRALDLAVSLLMLVAAAPAMVATALAIWSPTGGRPLLSGANRRSGTTYRIWKFRTMRRDAETAGAVWATLEDPRVLPVGRFIRRSRLDELPQLWNVLRGDMTSSAHAPSGRCSCPS